jgi:hypothetical protein
MGRSGPCRWPSPRLLQHAPERTAPLTALGWRVLPSLRLGVALQASLASQERLIELDTALTTDSSNPLERGAHLHVKFAERSNAVSARAVAGLQ